MRVFVGPLAAAETSTPSNATSVQPGAQASEESDQRTVNGPTWVHALVGGTTVQSVRCRHCGYESRKEQGTFEISVPLRRAQSLSRPPCAKDKDAKQGEKHDEPDGKRDKIESKRDASDMSSLSESKQRALGAVIALGVSRAYALTALEKAKWDVDKAANDVVNNPEPAPKGEKINPSRLGAVETVVVTVSSSGAPVRVSFGFCGDSCEHGSAPKPSQCDLTSGGGASVGADMKTKAYSLRKSEWVAEVSGSESVLAETGLKGTLKFITNEGRVFECGYDGSIEPASSPFRFVASQGFEITGLEVKQGRINAFEQSRLGSLIKGEPTSDTDTNAPSSTCAMTGQTQVKAPDIPPAGLKYRVVYPDGVWVRVRPDMESDRVGTLDFGVIVTSLAHAVADDGALWVQHKTGWNVVTVPESKSEKIFLVAVSKATAKTSAGTGGGVAVGATPSIATATSASTSETKDRGPITKCEKGHGLKKFVTQHDNYFCDLCKLKVKRGTDFFGCRKCDWDVCRWCRAREPDWPCAICTFLNAASSDKCQMCTGARDTKGSSPALNSKPKTVSKTVSKSGSDRGPGASNGTIEGAGGASPRPFEGTAMTLLDAHGNYLSVSSDGKLVSTDSDSSASAKLTSFVIRRCDPPRAEKKGEKAKLYFNISDQSNQSALLCRSPTDGSCVCCAVQGKRLANRAKWHVEETHGRLFFVSASGYTIKAAPDGDVSCTAKNRGEWEGFIPFYDKKQNEQRDKKVDKKAAGTPRDNTLQAKPDGTKRNEVKGELTLQDCFLACLEPVVLPGFRCSKCSEVKDAGGDSKRIEKRIAEKSDLLFRLPRVMVVHFKRYALRGGKLVKISRKVKLPARVNMAPFCAPLPGDTRARQGARDIWYELSSVVVHGGSLSGGHYTAYVRHDGQWFFVSDSTVKEASFERDVCRAEAYMLFYDREEEKQQETEEKRQETETEMLPE